MFSKNGGVGWTAYNPSHDGASLARALALDKFGNTFIAGELTVLYPTSPNPIGTFALNSNGDYIWTNLYFSPPIAQSVGTAIPVDQANNFYVTGFSPGTNTSNNIVTIKYDNNGNQLWVQSYSSPGGGNALANAIAVDSLGNVYVTGYDTTAGGGTEMVTIKYSPSPSGSVQTNGSFLLETTGEPSETFDIKATSNFTNWLDLGTTNADTNGFLRFLDTNAPLFPNRFYLPIPQ
jgi:hypothetical protein